MVYSVVVLKFSIFWAISQSEPAAIPLLEGCLDMSKLYFLQNWNSNRSSPYLELESGPGKTLNSDFRVSIVSMSHPWISIDDYWIFQRGGKVFSSLLNISLKPEKCVCPLLDIRPKFTLSSHKYFSLRPQVFPFKPQIFISQDTRISASSLFVKPQIFVCEATNFCFSNNKYFFLKLTIFFSMQAIFIPKTYNIFL